MERNALIVASLAGAALTATPALADGGDGLKPDHIFLSVINGQFTSSFWVDNPDVPGEDRAGGFVTDNVNIFSEQMGGIPGFGPQGAGQSIHPGIFGELNGITVGVQLKDALRVWNGSNFDEISGDDAGETRMLVSGFTTPLGDTPVSETTVTSIVAGETTVLDDDWISPTTDEIDEHLQFVLADSTGAALSEAEAGALSEIFLVTLEFTTADFGSTGDIFLVLSQGASDAELARAVAFIPAPGVAPVAALAALAAVRRRRHA